MEGQVGYESERGEVVWRCLRNPKGALPRGAGALEKTPPPPLSRDESQKLKATYSGDLSKFHVFASY